MFPPSSSFTVQMRKLRPGEKCESGDEGVE